LSDRRSALPVRPGVNVRAAEGLGREKTNMDLAIQGSIWLGAGVTLVVLIARRRKRRSLQ